MRRLVRAILASPLILAACGGDGGASAPRPARGAASRPALGAVIPCGLRDGYAATLVMDHLRNPAGVAFDGAGRLTVCDGFGGVVVLDEAGRRSDHVTEFKTEPLRPDAATGKGRFQHGPLSAVWIGATLAVTDAGQADGREAVHFYTTPGEAAEGAYTTFVGPDGGSAGDPAIGTLTGLAVAPDQDTLWCCGVGAGDRRAFLLRARRSAGSLEAWCAADDHGLAARAPMQAVVESERHVLVLYAGDDGVDDGRIIRWNVETRAPEGEWTLPGLTDPTGMARIPGSAELAVVDHRWGPPGSAVRDGRLARVTLPPAGGEARVTVIGAALRGPVSCAFGPDRRLYVTQVGDRYDQARGQVIAITGF